MTAEAPVVLICSPALVVVSEGVVVVAVGVLGSVGYVVVLVVDG